MLIATLFIVVKHVHQGELVKIIMIFIHVTRYRSSCASPNEKKKNPPKQNILPKRIPNIIQFLYKKDVCEMFIQVQ